VNLTVARRALQTRRFDAGKVDLSRQVKPRRERSTKKEGYRVSERVKGAQSHAYFELD